MSNILSGDDAEILLCILIASELSVKIGVIVQSKRSHSYSGTKSIKRTPSQNKILKFASF